MENDVPGKQSGGNREVTVQTTTAGSPPGYSYYLPAVWPTPKMFFILNPFEVDIIPAIPEGFKLFMKATEWPKDEKLVELSQVNCKAVMNIMDTLASLFSWGSLINLVPVYARNGEEVRSSSWESLICQGPGLGDTSVMALATM